MLKHIPDQKIHPQSVIFIVGPTAVGKTRIVSELSKRLRLEVISCDSMQVYKGMQILTAAPNRSIRQKLTHHLVAILSAQKNYSVADFLTRSSRLIKKIHKQGHIPVFAGGSGLYMKGLLDGIFKGPGADQKIRAQLYNLSKRYGKNYLYKRLRQVDPIASSRIHPADTRRIIRALEVYKLTHTPISRLQTQSQGLLKGYDVHIFGLNLRRDLLYQRIDKRVEEMFKQGVLAEINILLKKRLSKTARQVIGINEIKGYLESDYDLEEAKRLMKRNSRRYAKRQLTWFRKDRRIRWINIDNKSNKDIVKVILKHISSD